MGKEKETETRGVVDIDEVSKYPTNFEDFGISIEDVEAAVEDLSVFYRIGHRVANSSEWPEWYEGNEFRAIREASLEQ